MASYESWRVYIGFGRDPNDRTAPLTDVTSSVDTAEAPILIFRGRSSERSTIGPGMCSFALQNSDQRHTPGNPFSQYAPWVLAGRRVVVTDTVDGEEFELFDGTIEFPDADDWQKSSEDAPRDQVISVNAVDRVSRLEQSRRFHSTLGEHIRHNGGTALEAWWPLTETVGKTVRSVVGEPWPLSEFAERSSFGAVTANDPSFPSIEYAVGDQPPSAELSTIRFEPSRDTVVGVYNDAITLKGSRAVSLSLAAGQVMTVVAWMVIEPQLAAGTTFPFYLPGTSSGSATLKITSAGILQGIASRSGWSGSVDGPTPPIDVVFPVALRFGFDPDVIELWLKSDVYTGTMTVTTPNTQDFADMQLGVAFDGVLGNVQVYLGAESDWTHEDFLAQSAMGWDALERQRVDERITTLAAYAGLSGAELQLDTASALMPAGRLAGQTAGTLMREAAAADNGLLFANGSGRVVFHNRARRYRPPPAATVDLTWLEPPLQWRTDPPTNTMAVTSSSGVEGQASNADSVTEFGERGGSADLDTVSDADPGNLAAFTVREFGRPRHRATSLAFELRTRTTDQKKLILRREISDRCALSGLPDNAPEGTNTFHIEGIRHRISVQGHRVEWTNGAVLGDVPGVVQSYPRVGQAKVRSETKIPY